MSDTPAQAATPAETEVPETEATAPETVQATASTDDYEALIAKHTRAISEIKALRETKNSLRTQVAEMEARLAEASTSAAAASQAQERASALEAELRTERLRGAITQAAQRTRLTDPALVARLLDPTKVEWGTDGQPSNIEALISDLVAAHPVLAAQPATGAVVAPNLRDTTPRNAADLAGLNGAELLTAMKNLTKRGPTA